MKANLKETIRNEYVHAQKYYQEANVYVFFGISHYWKEEAVDDD